MILDATYKASGNHERTCVSDVATGDVAELASFARLGALTGATSVEIVLRDGAAAVTSTVSVTAPTSSTTEKMARSPSASEISRAAVLKPAEETWISKLPAESPERAKRPSSPEASV